MPTDRLGVVFGNSGHMMISTTHLSEALKVAHNGRSDAVALSKALFIDICLGHVAEDRVLQAEEIRRRQIVASSQANAF